MVTLLSLPILTQAFGMDVGAGRALRAGLPSGRITPSTRPPPGGGAGLQELAAGGVGQASS